MSKVCEEEFKKIANRCFFEGVSFDVARKGVLKKFVRRFGVSLCSVQWNKELKISCFA